MIVIEQADYQAFKTFTKEWYRMLKRLKRDLVHAANAPMIQLLPGDEESWITRDVPRPENPIDIRVAVQVNLAETIDRLLDENDLPVESLFAVQHNALAWLRFWAVRDLDRQRREWCRVQAIELEANLRCLEVRWRKKRRGEPNPELVPTE
jgi:hypothetical protein